MLPKNGLMAPARDESGEGIEQSAVSEQASPQEEAQTEALLQPVMDLLHGKGAATTLAKLKAGKERLAETIGMIAAQMIMQIDRAVGQQGGKVEDSVKMEVGQEIVIDLVEIAAAAGLVGDDDESKGALFKESMMNAIGAYGDLAAKAGLIDRDQAKQMLGQLTQNNQNPIAKNVAAMLQQGQPQAAPGEVQP